MWVIRRWFGGRWVVAVGRWVVVPSGPEMDVLMSWSPRLVRSVSSDDRVRVRLGLPALFSGWRPATKVATM